MWPMGAFLFVLPHLHTKFSAELRFHSIVSVVTFLGVSFFHFLPFLFHWVSSCSEYLIFSYLMDLPILSSSSWSSPWWFSVAWTWLRVITWGCLNLKYVSWAWLVTEFVQVCGRWFLVILIPFWFLTFLLSDFASCDVTWCDHGDLMVLLNS